MEQNGYNFLIMVKGMKEFISDIILENHGKFENSRAKYNDRYDVYGTTIKQYLYEGDQKKRNIHIYYSDGRAMGKSRRSSKKYSIFWKCVLCVVRKLRVSKKNNEHYIDRNTPGKNKKSPEYFYVFLSKSTIKNHISKSYIPVTHRTRQFKHSFSTICDNQSQGIFMKIEFPCL